LEEGALEMEKSRGADDQADQMSQALNRLRAMLSLPKYSPPMPRPRQATAVGWRDRLESNPRRGRRRRRWASEPQQIPSAGTWTWPWTSGART
jgi:hypothetical protein